MVQTLGYNNLTVSNNIFWGAVDGIWQDGIINGSTIGNATFRNNFIGMSGIDGGGGTWQIGGDVCTNGPYTFENNTFYENSSPQLVSCTGTDATNTIIRNNFFKTNAICHSAGTYPQPTWSYNAFAPGQTACGTNTKTCTPTWLNTPANNSSELNFTNGWDLHLNSSDTCLAGAADQTNHAPTDIDDQTRPQGSLVDAGADEIGTGGSGGGGTPLRHPPPPV